jgi:hypothetical protein
MGIADTVIPAIVLFYDKRYGRPGTVIAEVDSPKGKAGRAANSEVI